MNLTPLLRKTRGILHPELIPDEDDPNAYCRPCEKTYVNRNSFRHHIKTIHEMAVKPIPFVKKAHHRIRNSGLIPDVNDTNFYCRACEKTYVSWNSYRDHLRKIHDMRFTDKKYSGSKSQKRKDRKKWISEAASISSRKKSN